MNFIDEKGRLFGKINIIDFFVLFLLLCSLPIVYFGYQMLVKQKSMQKQTKDFTEITINCKFINLNSGLIKSLNIGDKELDENEEVIGEITYLGSSEPYIRKFDIGNDTKVLKKDPVLLQLPVVLRLKADIRPNGLFYKNTLITNGKSLNFCGSSYCVVAIPEKDFQLESDKLLILNVALKNISSDDLKLITVGDKDTDEHGQILAEILEIGNIDNSFIDLRLGEGNFVRGEDNLKKQISAKMRMRCQIDQEGNLYFKGKNVMYDVPFEFATNKYKIRAMLEDIFRERLSIRQKWLKLQVKFSGLIPEIAGLVKEGDTENNIQGEAISRICSIISNKPSDVMTLKQENVVILNHPFNRDIIASVDVSCLEKEGVYYFKNYPVKIGNNINTGTELYSIYGTIICLEIKKGP